MVVSISEVRVEGIGVTATAAIGRQGTIAETRRRVRSFRAGQGAEHWPTIHTLLSDLPVGVDTCRSGRTTALWCAEASKCTAAPRWRRAVMSVPPGSRVSTTWLPQKPEGLSTHRASDFEASALLPSTGCRWGGKPPFPPSCRIPSPLNGSPDVFDTSTNHKQAFDDR